MSALDQAGATLDLIRAAHEGAEGLVRRRLKRFDALRAHAAVGR